MAKTYTYDPEKITIQIDGVYLTGYSDGGVVKIEATEESVKPLVGAEGSIHYSINHNKTGTATVPMMSTSPMMPFLRELASTTKKFNFTMVDMNDNGINISCDDCMIIKIPDYVRNKEAEEVSVEIFIPEITK